MGLEALVADVERSHGRDKEALLRLLREVRNMELRKSALVAKWGRVALSRYGPSRLGDEVWSIYEQTLVAALDVHDTSLSEECEVALCKRFATGARVARLRGMCEEERGDFDLAKDTYEEMLEDNAANAAALRREICILKAQVKQDVNKDLAVALNAYLEKFQSDAPVWQALGELHVRAGQWANAIFCYEELVLFEPLSHHYHARLGELHYTEAAKLAGRKRLAALRTGRTYTAQALELQKHAEGRSVRAAHALLLTCSAIAQLTRLDDEDPADIELNAALASYATSRIKAIYKKDAAGLASFVAPILALHAPPYAKPEAAA